MSYIHVDRHSQAYTRCYCEENVWHLCRELQQKAQSVSQSSNQSIEIFVVFVSNPNQQVAFWHQRSPDQSINQSLIPLDLNDFVVWDYHVVLLMVVKQADINRPITQSFIYDLDTNLPFPCTFEQYVEEALKTPQSLARSINQSNNLSINLSLKQLKRFCNRYFRVVSTEHFLSEFASDRSHMIKQPSKQLMTQTADTSPVEWMSPPPTYPCIQPVIQATSQPSNQSVKLANNLDLYRFIPSEADQSLDLSVYYATNQSANQSISQSINQSKFGSITPVHSMIYDQQDFVRTFGSTHQPVNEPISQ